MTDCRKVEEKDSPGGQGVPAQALLPRDCARFPREVRGTSNRYEVPTSWAPAGGQTRRGKCNAPVPRYCTHTHANEAQYLTWVVQHDDAAREGRGQIRILPLFPKCREGRGGSSIRCRSSDSPRRSSRRREEEEEAKTGDWEQKQTRHEHRHRHRHRHQRRHRRGRADGQIDRQSRDAGEAQCVMQSVDVL